MGLRSFIHRLTAPKPNYNTPDGEIKLVLIVNHGLRMGKGKIAAQAGHASVNSVMKCGQKKPGLLDLWLSQGQKKICLKVESAEELEDIATKARTQDILVTKVNDAGKTQIPAGSLTFIALGPDLDSKLEPITGELKLL